MHNLYGLISLYEAYYLTKICNQLCLDIIYIEKIVEFIDNIIKYFINLML